MEIGSMGAMMQGTQMTGMQPQGMRPGGPPSERAEEMSSKIMENADSDSDGLLSTDELGSSFSSEMLSALDTDGDGLLSEEELQAGIQSNMEEAEAGFASGTEPSVENREFMQQMHSLAGDQPPPPPNQQMGTEAYSMMQESMFGGQGAAYNTDQMVLDSLNISV